MRQYYGGSPSTLSATGCGQSATCNLTACSKPSTSNGWTTYSGYYYNSNPNDSGCVYTTRTDTIKGTNTAASVSPSSACSAASISTSTTTGTTYYNHSYCYKDGSSGGYGCPSGYTSGGNLAVKNYRYHLTCTSSTSNSCSSGQYVDETYNYSGCYNNYCGSSTTYTGQSCPSAYSAGGSLGKRTDTPSMRQYYGGSPYTVSSTGCGQSYDYTSCYKNGSQQYSCGSASGSKTCVSGYQNGGAVAQQRTCTYWHTKTYSNAAGTADRTSETVNDYGVTEYNNNGCKKTGVACASGFTSGGSVAVTTCGNSWSTSNTCYTPSTDHSSCYSDGSSSTSCGSASGSKTCVSGYQSGGALAQQRSCTSSHTRSYATSGGTAVRTTTTINDYSWTEYNNSGCYSSGSGSGCPSGYSGSSTYKTYCSSSWSSSNTCSSPYTRYNLTGCSKPSSSSSWTTYSGYYYNNSTSDSYCVKTSRTDTLTCTDTAATSTSSCSTSTTTGTTYYNHSYCYKDVSESVSCGGSGYSGNATKKYRKHLTCTSSTSNSCSSTEDKPSRDCTSTTYSYNTTGCSKTTNSTSWGTLSGYFYEDDDSDDECVKITTPKTTTGADTCGTSATPSSTTTTTGTASNDYGYCYKYGSNAYCTNVSGYSGKCGKTYARVRYTTSATDYPWASGDCWTCSCTINTRVRSTAAYANQSSACTVPQYHSCTFRTNGSFYCNACSSSDNFPSQYH